MPAPIIIDFPLRGEWIAPNTPGTRVPSHGTDMLGERYAYDFVGIAPGDQSKRFYRSNPLAYLIRGVRLQDCYGWGRPIFAAAAGTVLRAEDGWPERDPVNVVRDAAVMIKNARAFQSKPVDELRALDLRALTGNFVIIESREGYFVYAHAQTGSIRVAPGDKVTAGQHLANVGHSGNSTAPHLHFQLMDNPDPWIAQGLPCCFREYEIFENGNWRMVRGSMPRVEDRIRKV